MKRRSFLKATGALTVGSLLMGGSGIVYSKKIEPSWVDVHAISLRLPRLTAAFRGYRIVQMSDLHVDYTFMDSARLSGLVDLVNAQEPDAIVITGDFVTNWDSPFEQLESLRRLRAHDGVFAVLGNHDHWSGADRLRTQLQSYGIHELNDALHTVYRGGTMLHLVGLDDLWPDSSYIAPLWTHRDRLTRLMDQLPKEGAVILLVHEPDFADVAASIQRIDLQLSGHSHGGQVRIPLYGVIKVPPLATRYPDGMYSINQLQLYTNRGLGMVDPQVRFDCRPEISVFTCI
jgi:predicted MPP superfamily phosphohydrolase